MRFRSVLCPDPAVGGHDALQTGPPSRMGREYPLTRRFLRLDSRAFSASISEGDCPNICCRTAPVGKWLKCVVRA